MNRKVFLVGGLGVGVVVEEGGVVGVFEAFWEEFWGEGEGLSVEDCCVVFAGGVLFVVKGSPGIDTVQGFVEVSLCEGEVVVLAGMEVSLVFGGEGEVVVLALGAGVVFPKVRVMIETFVEESEISAVFGGEAKKGCEGGGGS